MSDVNQGCLERLYEITGISKRRAFASVAAQEDIRETSITIEPKEEDGTYPMMQAITITVDDGFLPVIGEVLILTLKRGRVLGKRGEGK